MNDKILQDFFEALKKKDYKSMASFYSSEIKFSDPLYDELNFDEVKAMWEKFFIDSKNLQVQVTSISVDGNKGKATWNAHYIFRANDNEVNKEVVSTFEFKEGKIIKHTDEYDFHEWAGKALGLMGSLLGWTGFVENQVKQNARKNLESFMSDEL